jgi:hypothetical protein
MSEELLGPHTDFSADLRELDYPAALLARISRHKTGDDGKDSMITIWLIAPTGPRAPKR